MANHLNDKHWKQRRWSESDSRFLVDNYKALGPTRCSASLGAPMPTVLYYAKRLGLRDTTRAKQKPWSEQDIAYLVENHGKKTLAEIAAHLDRTETSVYAKSRWLARKPGSTIKAKFPRLSAKEKRRIEKLNKQKLSDSSIASIIHRSVNSVGLYLESKGLPSYKDGPAPWTEDEIRYLVENYRTLGGKACADGLPGRTLYAVQKKIHQLKKDGKLGCAES